MMVFSWSRYNGYEVSTKGDKRFSAFNAVLEDGRSIEEHYQCDVKGYQPGGTEWRLGKGKPGLRVDVDLWAEEVQTKGKGSTFRLCDPQGRRTPVLGEELHEPLERMTRDISNQVALMRATITTLEHE